ncbi:MAG: DNA-binding transcriptional LysR family regulator [Paraglaciecola sp.]|jgi:DNA-binding transcriptional LysR family regulator
MPKNRDKLMAYMNEIDYLKLDGNILRVFLTVLEENSVSKAALKLHVSQSAISHSLDKLREIFTDPLFIREGRGITPTCKAKSLEDPIRKILNELKQLNDKKEFDPLERPLEYTIAANDFQLMFIFPALLKQLRSEGIDHNFHFIPSGVPLSNTMLNNPSSCQLLITPAPPPGKEYRVKPLLESKVVCFYDAEMRKPPKTWAEFVKCKYAEIKFSETESSMMVLPLINKSTLNAPTVTVANFGTLSPFVKGTELITTQLEIMSHSILKDLDFSPLPFDTPLVTLYMVWHQQYQDDPAHTWLRQRIINTVDSIISTN